HGAAAAPAGGARRDDFRPDGPRPGRRAGQRRRPGPAARAGARGRAEPGGRVRHPVQGGREGGLRRRRFPMSLPMTVRRTLSVARKEFLHMLRDPGTVFFALAIPVLELFMLGYAI